MLEPAADVEGFISANKDLFAGSLKIDLKERVNANMRGTGDITSFWRDSK